MTPAQEQQGAQVGRDQCCEQDLAEVGAIGGEERTAEGQGEPEHDEGDQRHLTHNEAGFGALGLDLAQRAQAVLDVVGERGEGSAGAGAAALCGQGEGGENRVRVRAVEIVGEREQRLLDRPAVTEPDSEQPQVGCEQRG